MMKLDTLFRNGLNYQRNDLANYFFREFKKAERDYFYTVETFFPPLYDNIKRHKEVIKKNLGKKEITLKRRLQLANNNELDYYGLFYSNPSNKQEINYEDFKSEKNKLFATEIENELKKLTAESVVSGYLFGFKLSEINLLEEKLKEAEKKLKPKKEKNKIALKDFFIDGVSPELITAIQEKFKHLRGKEMAILIYLLHKKYSLIYLDNNNRKANSRIHFFRAITSTNLKRTGINNFFEPITAETKVNEKDDVFVRINNQLKEMVCNG